jgi:hypothetical protein
MISKDAAYLIRSLRSTGYTWDQVADTMGRTVKSCQALFYTHVPKEERVVAPTLSGSVDITMVTEFGKRITIESPPFEVPMPVLADITQGPEIRAVLFGDVHIGYEDQRAIKILLSVLGDFEPHVIACVGDLLDCYKLSRFDKDPTRLESLQDEINRARALLHQVAQVVPDAKRVLYEGNHEDRLRRTIWRLAEQNKVLVELDDFREAMTWPQLLRLGEIGWDFVPYLGPTQGRYELLPKFIVKHGTLIRKWAAWTAKAEHDMYGKSGASGHTHRLAMYMQRDHNGNHVWVETGCLCRLDPDYVAEPNWQQGFVCITFDRATGAFGVEPVYIHQGLAVWRDRIYKG